MKKTKIFFISAFLLPFAAAGCSGVRGSSGTLALQTTSPEPQKIETKSKTPIDSESPDLLQEKQVELDRKAGVTTFSLADFFEESPANVVCASGCGDFVSLDPELNSLVINFAKAPKGRIEIVLKNLADPDSEPVVLVFKKLQKPGSEKPKKSGLAETNDSPADESESQPPAAEEQGEETEPEAVATPVQLTCENATVEANVGDVSQQTCTISADDGDELTAAFGGTCASSVVPELSTATGALSALIPAERCTLSVTVSRAEENDDVADQATFDVELVPLAYRVKGTASGIEGSGLTLSLNSSEQLAVSEDGEFSFSSELVKGANYAITIASTPAFPIQKCELSNATGSMPSADVLNVTLTCSIYKAVQISSGANHTCVLFEQGNVRCFGSSTYGETGYGTTEKIGDNEHPWSMGDVQLGQKATQISAGGHVSCALLEDKTVTCWGRNNKGQLGLGSSVETVGASEAPLTAGKVDVGDDVLQVDVGKEHVCVRVETSDSPPKKNVKCWGNGGSGRLGYENSTTTGLTQKPSAIGYVDLNDENVADIRAGDLSTCALMEGTGDLRCWGVRWGGRLGTKHSNNNRGDQSGEMPPPKATLGEATVSIAHSGSGTCIVNAAKQLKCFGWGGHGKHGLGFTGDAGSSVFPDTLGYNDIGGDVAIVDSFHEHTCAVRTDGKMLCWGRNNNGQLGLGTTTSTGASTPNSQGVIPLPESVVGISGGDRFTCAIFESGRVRCWGLGQQGRIGQTLHVGHKERVDSLGPVPLGQDVKAFNAAENSTCAILADDSMKCFGSSWKGRLGIPNETIAYGESSANPPSASPGVQIGFTPKTAFGALSSCAVSNTGAVKCWGNGSYSVNGQGNTSDIGVTDHPSDHAAIPFSQAAIQADSHGKVACAVFDNNTVQCWGDGSKENLGYGNLDSIGDDETADTAGAVSVGAPVTQVAVGASHTCVLTTAKEVKCWGKGDLGQLGQASTATVGDDELPSTTSSFTLGVSSPIALLAAGSNFTCALHENGQVKCWGDNQYGQLGIGSTDNIGDDELASTSQVVALTEKATAIVAGDRHACALLESKKAQCWGFAGLGQLGYAVHENLGDDESVGTGQTVTIGASIQSLSAGMSHTCALTEDSKLFCWGSAENGRLGLGLGNFSWGDDETLDADTLYSSTINLQ